LSDEHKANSEVRKNEDFLIIICFTDIMSIISHAILAQRAMPVASQLISNWVLSCSVIEEDFLPEEEEASTSAVIISIPHARVLAVVTVVPGTGRILGSRLHVAGALEHPIKFEAARIFTDVEDKSVTFHITLPKLLTFEFRGEGPYKNSPLG